MTHHRITTSVLVWLFKPVARICLHFGMTMQDVHEACKRAFVQVAQEELAGKGTGQTTSKLSVMTGIHRAEVSRILEASDEPIKAPVAIKVVSHWRHSKKYQQKNGSPKPLQVEGKQSEFVHLVKEVHTDLNPYTVLFELQRTNMVEVRSDGKLHLCKEIQAINDDIPAGLSMLADDLESLSHAVQQNMFSERTPKHLHIRASYDNLCLRYMTDVESWLLREGTLFQAKVSAYLANYDLDINKTLRRYEGGGKLSLTIFSFSEPPKPKK